VSEKVQGWSPFFEMGEDLESDLLDPLLKKFVGVLEGGNFHKLRQSGLVAIDFAHVPYQCKGTYSGVPLEWPGL
jgi:hypothetical protein